jgi:hypothetical protein
VTDYQQLLLVQYDQKRNSCWSNSRLGERQLGFLSKYVFENPKLGTEEKRGTTLRSSTDEIYKTPSWNNKTKKKKTEVLGKKQEHRT